MLNAMAWAAQGDVKGSKDHPMISRYAGSTISSYAVRAFDEGNLITGSVRTRGKLDDSNRLKLEGKIYRIVYTNPKGRSTLEVLRNYEQAMQKANFEILFTCKNNECGGRDFNHTVAPYTGKFGDNYRDQRYIVGKLARAEGDLYASIYIVRDTIHGGWQKNRVFSRIVVIETRPMQTGMVTFNVDAMAQEISQTGHIALYGIYFDTNKAIVKPESKPTIVEIAALLKKNPDLELVVVGHTDNVGSFDYNMGLSQRRAKAVAGTLVSEYGISAKRLQSWGVGYLSPVASNRSDEGRAKNRRVELVEK
jgi:outer membrane protein OmpA-like peptidoglycan-associated protein